MSTQHSSHSFTRPLALVLAVAVVLGLVFWFVRDEGVAPIAKVGEAAATETATEAPSAAPIELAAIPLTPDPSEATPIATPTATDEAAGARSIVGAALDGRTWKQLLVAVDRTTNEPIERVHLDLIDAEGVLRRVGMDEAVLATDLAEGVLLALDAPTHVPRFFFTKHLAGHTGAPRPVQLHPSGALSIALPDPPATPPPLDMRVYPAQRFHPAQSLDAHLAEHDIDTNDELEPFHALAKSLRNLLDESNEPRSRKRQLKWLGRTEQLHVALTPDGPPTVSGWSEAEGRGITTWPHVVADLPSGLDVALMLSPRDATSGEPSAEIIEMRLAGETAWDANLYSNLVAPITVGGTTGVEVRVAGAATVRGLLPIGATRGHMRVMRELSENSYTFVNDEDIAEDGAFVATGLAPGRLALTLNWHERDGALGVRAFELELAPGEDRDLGRIAVLEESRALTFVSSLRLDGAPNSDGLGGQLPTYEFRVHLQRYTPDDSSSFSRPTQELRVSGPGEFAVRGLSPGQYFVHVSELERPTEVERSYLVSTIMPTNNFDLSGGDARCTVEFSFKSSRTAEFVFNVPPAVKGSDVWVDAVAFSIDDGTEVSVDLRDNARFFGKQQARTFEAEAALPPGEWLIVAVARPTWQHDNDTSLTPYGGETLRSFVGTKRFSTDELGAPIVVDLELGAVLQVHAKPMDDTTGQTYVTARPADFPVTTTRMWYGFNYDERTSFEVWSLLPNTDYVDPEGKPLFRTGAGGSVTELDLR